jgi:hypothetical protein
MRKGLFVFALAFFAPLLIAQTAMNNDSIIKLCKSGLSDDVIVTTINSSPGDYKTSADDLVALKSGGASDKVIAAVVTKAAAPAAAASEPAPKDADAPRSSGEKVKPRVFLRSSSHGNARNQSMEMSKDFEKDCPDVRITVSSANADYIMMLNHIEKGWSRDNQVQIANGQGDLISNTKEGGSISKNVKAACQVILQDWAKK